MPVGSQTPSGFRCKLCQERRPDLIYFGGTMGKRTSWIWGAVEPVRLSLLVLGLAFAAPASAQSIRFEADTWVAECGAAPDSDCSIIGVFKSSNPTGPAGSYPLLVDLRKRLGAIVGKPPRAVQRCASIVTLLWRVAARVTASSRRAIRKPSCG